jgi:hypothetical protein
MRRLWHERLRVAAPEMRVQMRDPNFDPRRLEAAKVVLCERHANPGGAHAAPTLDEPGVRFGDDEDALVMVTNPAVRARAEDWSGEAMGDAPLTHSGGLARHSLASVRPVSEAEPVASATTEDGVTAAALRAEGARGLYKGMVRCFLKVVLSMAIAFATYEALRTWWDFAPPPSSTSKPIVPA